MKRFCAPVCQTLPCACSPGELTGNLSSLSAAVIAVFFKKEKAEEQRARPPWQRQRLPGCCTRLPGEAAPQDTFVFKICLASSPFASEDTWLFPNPVRRGMESLCRDPARPLGPHRGLMENPRERPGPGVRGAGRAGQAPSSESLCSAQTRVLHFYSLWFISYSIGRFPAYGRVGVRGDLSSFSTQTSLGF